MAPQQWHVNLTGTLTAVPEPVVVPANPPEPDPIEPGEIALPFTPTYSVTLDASQYTSKSAYQSQGWDFDIGAGTSPDTEEITLDDANNRFVHKAGGYDNSSHYARIKRKLPETDSVLPAGWFSLKVDAEIMSDHYSVAQGYMRCWGNTDNFRTSAGHGAQDSEEWRCSFQMWSDKKWRLVSEEEPPSGQPVTTNNRIILWTSATEAITPGRHTVQMVINPKQSATGAWYLYLDGALTASATNVQTVPNDVDAGEIEITRIVCGIDGAAPQDDNLLTTYTYSMRFDAA